MKVTIETNGVKYKIYDDVTNITIETENGVHMWDSTKEMKLKEDDATSYYQVEEAS